MFGQIIEILDSSPIIADYEIHQLIEESSASFLRVEVTLVNGSQLFMKELWFPHESKYSYHWQNAAGKLLLRWDNAPHHPEIATYPDHKHIGDAVFPSSRISIEEVLRIISAQLDEA